MNKQKLKARVIRITTRDISLPKRIFIYLFLSLLSIVFILEVFIFKYIIFRSRTFPTEIDILIALFLVGGSYLFSGYVVDLIKNRTLFFNVIFGVCIAGLILVSISNFILEYIGLVITLISITFMANLWFTILIYETNILNRGRLIAYLLMFSFPLGLFGSLLAINELSFMVFVIFEFILFIGILFLSRKYTYIENEERLRSKESFKQIIMEKHFFRYISSFTMLSFILGNLLALYGFTIEFFTFSIATFLYTITAGIFLDNIGRKTSIVVGILVLSFFLISYGSFTETPFIYGMPRLVFLSFHYAFSLSPLLLAVFTISGDLSTERQNLKYRARINGLFMSLVFFGIISGFLFSRLINFLYATYPVVNLIVPNLPEYLNAFILVVLLVWMMAMKEFLVSKESKWAEHLHYLYIINPAGVCLYNYNFDAKKSESLENLRDNEDDIDVDLVSGALSGVLTILSEITKSNKQLRKIVKKGRYIYFSYGKKYIVSLISSMDLPVLLKKLDKFSKDFGERFKEEINNFAANVSVFDDTKILVEHYFNQKHSFFLH
ncbi:MAG: hypothetical protein GF317_08060 [Candidatus Lokiarchaeota archaeon]|nr:hypothetical protein [Candidatus Lokiarchaeota archaeon]MBD3199667.1 hypothetical protein [Candidatus Lokiarchaeota archaeon]